MKLIILILVLSASIYAQTDICKATSNIEPKTPSGVTIDEINKIINEESDKSKILFLNIPAGTYSGDKGVLIKRDNVCLRGIDKPTLKRTKFDNEQNEQSVIKIFGVSNISVKGFEIEGTISRENRNAGPSGITVVNFEDNKPEGISNIYIEENIIHNIGQLYEFDKEDGFWRYRNDAKDPKYDKKTECESNNKKKVSNIKITCGQAHGIYVASNRNLVKQVIIKGNTLSYLRLGESEAITLGEHISDFDVSENTIYDIDNIGIDIAGQQNGIYQSSTGIVHRNIIYDLKGFPKMDGQNDSYPFVAGIYIDGGTGLNWDKPIRITGNFVANFGIGISVGSENNYCNYCNYCKENPNENNCREFCKPDKCKSKKCPRTKTEFVLLKSNTLLDNQVYGIGIGKDSSDQNSQTWNIKVIGNVLINNVSSKDESGYSQLHFGSLEKDSLKEIEIRGNTIKAIGENSRLLVRVVGLANLPEVKFYENTFYSDSDKLWSWGTRSDQNSYTKSELVLDGKTLKMPYGVKGEKNIWDSIQK